MAIHHGRVERFHDDQLIVALPDLDVVTGALANLGVGQGKADTSAALGLALIPGLTGVTQAVAALQRDPVIGAELERFRADLDRAHPGAPGLADLDLLIKGIRLRFADMYPGWEVTIGKNYGPSLIKGHPHIGGGGDGDPVPADAAFTLPVSGRGRGVRVGVLDTRMFPDESMTGRYLAGPDDLLRPEDGPFTVFDGHCAFVSSCILQRAPAAELIMRHVLDRQGNGSAWEAAVAMAELAQLELDVVNLSFGEFLTDDNTAPMVLETAVKRFGPRTVVVAAAGNNGDVNNLPAELVHEGVKPNSASYPAALPDVVGVGALDGDGKLASFTPDPAPWIALLAPGVGLTGAYLKGDVIIEHKDKNGKVLSSRHASFGGSAVWEGCSFAAGVVTGEIAARVVPGRRSAREALDELMRPAPSAPGCGIVPN